MPKRNSEMLMEQSLYDMLISMNNNILQAMYANERPCIMTALGEANRNIRCQNHSPECGKCLQKWLNEFPF